jgi:hypothetical protein
MLEVAEWLSFRERKAPATRVVQRWNAAFRGQFQFVDKSWMRERVVCISIPGTVAGVALVTHILLCS